MLVMRDPRRKRQVVQKGGERNRGARTENNSGGVRNNTGSRFNVLQNENVAASVGDGQGTH